MNALPSWVNGILYSAILIVDLEISCKWVLAEPPPLLEIVEPSVAEPETVGPEIVGPAVVKPSSSSAPDAFPTALSPATPEPAVSGTDALARLILLKTLPREYENSKHWGQTKRRWNGLDVSLDGLRLDTKRRWKEVNHGTWTRYRAWLINPEHELHVQFSNLRQNESQAAVFDIIVDAHIGASGRVSEWNRGVQLYSLSADAEGRVRMQMACELHLSLDATHFPPDVLVVPRVTHAKVDLTEFQLHRISQADGPLVRELGQSIRNDLNREINERQPKLVEKINRAITKNKDHLRLSLHDLAANGWDSLLEKTTE